jgi:hypothetical protein
MRRSSFCLHCRIVLLQWGEVELHIIRNRAHSTSPSLLQWGEVELKRTSTYGLPQ